MVALAALVVLVAVLRRTRPPADDPIVRLQALELEVHEEGETRTVRASVPILIGRQPSATIVVRDLHVSRQHARIDRMDGALVIRDLDSRNGTIVNGKPLARMTPLVDGDRIDVGNTRVVLVGTVPWN